ncbi:hypothetical protein ACQ4PT_057322 [Festuca glaucescens]
MDTRALSPDEQRFRAMLKMNSLGIAAMQRSMWRQRSRVAWLKEGDASTRFFHAKANARRRKSYIHRLELDGNSYTEQEEKEEIIWKYFDELIGTKKDRPHSVNFPFLDMHQISLPELDIPISSAEVKGALYAISSNCAPGPDGFSALFFKLTWDIIAADVMRAIQAVEACRSDQLDLLNDATMILLPKTPELPIRCWTWDYKEFLESLVRQDVRDKSNDFPIETVRLTHDDDTSIEFELTLDEKNMQIVMQEGMEKKLNLITTVGTTNMRLFDRTGLIIRKYKTPEEILEEFFDLRLEYYEKRKKMQLESLNLDLLKISNQVRFILNVGHGDITVIDRELDFLLPHHTC